MPRRTLATALVLPAVLLLALTGCTAPGGSGDDGSGSGSGSGSGDGSGDSAGDNPTVCVSGDWSADLQGLASQMLEYMTSSGSPITSVTASGTQDLAIDESGVLGFGNNMVFVSTANLGEGLVMTLTQTHAGGVGADWAWDGDAEGTVMIFENFNDSEYVITNTVDINGQSAEAPFPAPDMAAANVPLTVVCEGDVMTTKPEVSPFTTTWHRQ